MGPTIMRRERGVETLVDRPLLNSLTRSSGHAVVQVGQAAVIALAPIVFALASPQARHWLVEAAANLLVLGGFIAAPILTVVAWVGLLLPARLPLHQLSSTLFVVALIWVASGLLIAHVLHDTTEAAK